ncbi:hypothetical protein [Thermoflexus sp.]|uniref:hypothetical protein n=1 Tax=Thermoflexus sp. TaxID=1969742 RepID=UPI0025E6104F|nr:hypothetical protein [Thermoflexus sp.]MDW8180909.1 hypothetical protein [Anaerolineae bacterium]MCS6964626.1 hypothetical protein [Thermoflexus sp.]MCS7351452.1 hypothetical protein [Thermoflexus sp.]MCX7691237.1 hypothetical protein [Thermoflexus sp.]MDW8184989.1 hypothetical protein [Anaerolineae bacterium]
MGRIYQVDYERAFALCAEMERIISEMEGQAAALQGMLEPMGSGWIPHGAAVQAYGGALAQRARIHLSENRAAVAALRQSLHSLKALEEEQARRMRSARAR